MKMYHFIAILSQGTECTDDLAEAMFEAGNADGTLWSHGQVAGIRFSREAESLEAAIRSAFSDVKRAGATVVEVKLEAEDLAALVAN